MPDVSPPLDAEHPASPRLSNPHTYTPCGGWRGAQLNMKKATIVLWMEKSTQWYRKKRDMYVGAPNPNEEMFTTQLQIEADKMGLNHRTFKVGCLFLVARPSPQLSLHHGPPRARCATIDLQTRCARHGSQRTLQGAFVRQRLFTCSGSPALSAADFAGRWRLLRRRPVLRVFWSVSVGC
jgi:hypothetical protein